MCGRISRPPAEASGAAASHAILRDAFELFHSTVTGIAKLSIETSNDLFEMDSQVTPEQILEFKSKRSEWLERFDAALRELFERRLSGTRRKGRRPDPVQSFESLSVMSDKDTSSQHALKQVTKRLAEAGEAELDVLDHRVAVLFNEVGHARRRQSAFDRLPGRRDRHDLTRDLRQRPHLASVDVARRRGFHSGDQQDLHPGQPLSRRAKRPSGHRSGTSRTERAPA
jgi:hypothetical protein